ncbi:TnsD family Tn7-like transposition protein [Endozoicomonas acroporae]|uniref:TnsD family Tn7-like transposition protein n=1 Tax=Endozoicomonas acroporae TaxID=1701104 RepID=UPI000C76081D|nr:TnsD family Tn7-like transposition protein [Endozoicomonas acroporae]
MVLSYFPVPYPDELLYSIIARYGIHTGQSGNRKAILRDVFGTDTATAIPDLPSHLRYLVQHVGQVWQISEKDIIKRYTLAPFYLPFLKPDLAEKIVSSMNSNRGGDIHTRCGISAGALTQPAFFRYCPSCVQQQNEQFGESCWLRSHHIPGIDVCIYHSQELLSAKSYFHSRHKHLFSPAVREVTDQTSAHVELKDIEIKLHRLYSSLMGLQKITGLSSHQWTVFYKQLADQLGFKKGSRVDHQSIRRHIENDWFGTCLNRSPQVAAHYSWLTQMFRKHRKSFHPIRHMMVWASLLPEVPVKTIFTRVSRLPAEPDKKGTFPLQVTQPTIKTREYRQAWLMLLKKYPDIGIKALRSTGERGALYAWLYRHDRQWLMSHRPDKVVNHSKQGKVDYGKWDEENVLALACAFKTLNKKSGRCRLSRTFLVKQLPRHVSVDKHLKKLPKTRQWLLGHAESIEDFQLFRVLNAAEELKRQNLPLKRWRLLRVAGIRFESVTKRIETVIQKLEQQRSLD